MNKRTIHFIIQKPVFLLAGVLMFLTGCARISGSIHSLIHAPNFDFMKSEVITNGPVPADGQSELLMVIQLRNSDGTSVIDYKPTYDVISGGSVTTSECTTSNNNGVSTCTLKSSQTGIKRISVTNIKIHLESDVNFSAPGSKPEVGVIASAGVMTSGHYTLSLNIGSQDSAPSQTVNRHTLYGGVQSSSTSH